MEEPTAYIFRVAVKMEVARSTEMLVSAYRTTCYNTGDHNLKITLYNTKKKMSKFQTIVLMGMEGILYGLYGPENTWDCCSKTVQTEHSKLHITVQN